MANVDSPLAGPTGGWADGRCRTGPDWVLRRPGAASQGAIAPAKRRFLVWVVRPVRQTTRSRLGHGSNCRGSRVGWHEAATARRVSRCPAPPLIDKERRPTRVPKRKPWRRSRVRSRTLPLGKSPACALHSPLARPRCQVVVVLVLMSRILRWFCCILHDECFIGVGEPWKRAFCFLEGGLTAERVCPLIARSRPPSQLFCECVPFVSKYSMY